MDKKINHYEAELLGLPPLRFMLSGSPTREKKEVLRVTPVHGPGQEMEINVRKLIAHLNKNKLGNG